MKSRFQSNFANLIKQFFSCVWKGTSESSMSNGRCRPIRKPVLGFLPELLSSHRASCSLRLRLLLLLNALNSTYYARSQCGQPPLAISASASS